MNMSPPRYFFFMEEPFIENHPDMKKAIAETIDKLCTRHGIKSTEGVVTSFGGDYKLFDYTTYFTDIQVDLDSLTQGFKGEARFMLEVDGSPTFDLWGSKDTKGLYEIVVRKSGERARNAIYINAPVPVSVWVTRIEGANTLAEYRERNSGMILYAF